MRIPKATKLRLNKDTLRTLHSAALAQAVGGGAINNFDPGIPGPTAVKDLCASTRPNCDDFVVVPR